MKLYTTYEEPLNGRVFTEKQMKEVYRDLVDKSEYLDFECWLLDMLKSGVFEEILEDTFFIWDDLEHYTFNQIAGGVPENEVKTMYDEKIKRNKLILLEDKRIIEFFD